MQHVKSISIRIRIALFPEWETKLLDASGSAQKAHMPAYVDGCFELTINWAGAKRLWSEKRISDLHGLTRYIKKLIDQGYLRDRSQAEAVVAKCSDQLVSLRDDAIYNTSVKNLAGFEMSHLGLSPSLAVVEFWRGLLLTVNQKYPKQGSTEEDPSKASATADAERRV